MENENTEVPPEVDIDAEQARQEGEDAFLDGDAPEPDPVEEGGEGEEEQKVDYLQDPSKLYYC
jgi:hypothetical protein